MSVVMNGTDLEVYSPREKNAELQKKIDEMNKGSEAGRKANEEQMTKLNSQLTELQKTNKSQGEMFGVQLKTMQESNGKLQNSIDSLTAKNNEYSDKLAKAESLLSMQSLSLQGATHACGTLLLPAKAGRSKDLHV